MVATVSTSIAAIWQSLCPYLIRRGQGSIWPQIIDHVVTQAATIIISALLTVFNFFSWIVLAANNDGAKTTCGEGHLSNRSGYGAQCRGVNVAIVFDAIVFLLWIPIALVIVCGLIETMKGGHRTHHQGPDRAMVEEYDLKRAGVDQAYNASVDNVSQVHYDEVQAPNIAYVTPIASQFRASEDEVENGQ
ncbi:hypothetical protein BGZ65_011020, partial [Modicella reniformis]